MRYDASFTLHLSHPVCPPLTRNRTTQVLTTNLSVDGGAVDAGHNVGQQEVKDGVACEGPLDVLVLTALRRSAKCEAPLQGRR